MKKLVIAVLACAGLMAPAQDQDKVSLNTLGYIRNVSNPGLHIAALQFEVPTSTVTAVYGDTMPISTAIYRYDSVNKSYSATVYANAFVGGGFVLKWSEDIDLVSGEGFWVEVPDSAGTLTNLFLGEVPSADSITNVLVEGLNLVSYPYPMDRVVTNLGIVLPSLGDRIYTFIGNRYQISSYIEMFDIETFSIVPAWDQPGLVIKAGTGFWYQTDTENTWVATKAF